MSKRKQRVAASAKTSASAGPKTWLVEYHWQAVEDLLTLSASEQKGVRLVAEFLRQLGTKIKEPHMKAVQGERKIRELRPGGGRSSCALLWIQRDGSTQRASINPHGEITADALSSDDEFRRDWERHAPARMVAVKLIEYRYDHELSQRGLAEVLGVKQPQVARWESGESRPSDDNLALIAGKLGIEFVFSFAPKDRAPKQITKGTTQRAEQYSEAGAVVRFAAS